MDIIYSEKNKVKRKKSSHTEEPLELASLGCFWSQWVNAAWAKREGLDNSQLCLHPNEGSFQSSHPNHTTAIHTVKLSLPNHTQIFPRQNYL